MSKVTPLKVPTEDPGFGTQGLPEAWSCPPGAESDLLPGRAGGAAPFPAPTLAHQGARQAGVGGAGLLLRGSSSAC